MRQDQGNGGPSGAEGLSRRSLLGRALVTGAAISLPTWFPEVAVSAPCVPDNAFRASLSVSPFTETVLRSVTLTDGAAQARTVAEVQQLFNRHGASEVYQRIATRRLAPQGDAEHGWARGLDRARLAGALGMPFNPEIGLFSISSLPTSRTTPAFGYPVPGRL